MHTIKAVLYAFFFKVQKWALFSKGKKNVILRDSKRSSFITYFFELQFDMATLINPSFRMMEARGFEQRFKSDLSGIYIISNTIIQ